MARAAACGRSVRVGQASRSRHRRGDEILIDLSSYQRPVRIDREEGWATFEAGVSLHQLGVILGSWGLSMENGSRRPHQALGAAVSLGAHGTGARFGGLATQVTALRLIAPDGTVISCSDSEEPEIFNAARVGLGAVGIISTVTLRCQPGFNVRAHVATVDLDEALAGVDDDAEAHDYFELSWRPGRRRARVITADRTEEVPDGGAVDRSYRWWHRRRVWPPLIEYSFARSDSGPVLERARGLSAASRGAPLFPIEVSVTGGDEIPLSPAEGRPSLFVAGLSGLGGRPLWGTAHGMTPQALRALYPRWDEWQSVRDLLDPDRRLVQSSGQG